MSETRPLLDILAEAAGNPPKKRGHRYGLKAVHADFESSRGFVWPFPGGTAKSPKTPKPGGPCPSEEGDGLSVALTARGAAQGGHQLSTVLLVSFRTVYGKDTDKVRVGSADVLAVLDVPKLARAGLLRSANLRSANLRGADLHGANLRGANLHGANLHGANLREAYLRGANLREANLREAYLRGADLREANLRGAYLHGAYLHGANLRSANLRGADLRGAIGVER